MKEMKRETEEVKEEFQGTDELLVDVDCERLASFGDNVSGFTDLEGDASEILTAVVLEFKEDEIALSAEEELVEEHSKIHEAEQCFIPPTRKR